MMLGYRLKRKGVLRGKYKEILRPTAKPIASPSIKGGCPRLRVMHLIGFWAEQHSPNIKLTMLVFAEPPK
jgi:hypothetical protein